MFEFIDMGAKESEKVYLFFKIFTQANLKLYLH